MSVTPYLQVTDAKKAIDFYVEAFEAVEQFRLPAEDGKKIMHAGATASPSSRIRLGTAGC